MTQSSEPSGLLAEILQSHGGLERWNQIKAINVTFTFSGFLFAIKGYPKHYHVTMSIDPTRPAVTARGLGPTDEANTWNFDNDRVWLTNPDGKIITSIPDVRSTYAGHDRSTQWSDHHLTYFVSYAFWNYLTAPFLWASPGFSTRELEKHHEAGQTWRVLEVTFPDGVPTHTKVQKFYYDEEKLWLRKEDYVTDVAGGVASHYCFDHKLVGGIVVPFFRRVVRRDEPWGPSSVLLDYYDVEIIDKE